jgi:hypothetical protein
VPAFNSLGAILAVVVLVLCIVFTVLGQIPLMIGVLLAMLAVARLS